MGNNPEHPDFPSVGVSLSPTPGQSTPSSFPAPPPCPAAAGPQDSTASRLHAAAPHTQGARGPWLPARDEGWKVRVFPDRPLSTVITKAPRILTPQNR